MGEYSMFYLPQRSPPMFTRMTGVVAAQVLSLGLMAILATVVRVGVK